MAIAETYGIGYRGFLAVKEGGNYFVFPCTGAGPDKVATLIIPENIHATAASGTEIEQAAFRIHYAEGQNTYTGSITMPFYLNSTWWDIVSNWAYSGRTTPREIIFSPDGATFYKYPQVYVSRMAIDNRGANNLIEVTLDLTAKGREVVSSGLSGITLYLVTYKDTQNLVPVPYWKSSLSMEYIYSSFDFSVISWRVEITHNTVVTHVLNDSPDPYLIKQGLCVISGSTTIYKEKGVPEPDHRKGAISILIGPSGGQNVQLDMYNVAVETYPYPMRAPSAITTRDINFQAFAGEYDWNGSSTLKPALEITSNLT